MQHLSNCDLRPLEVPGVNQRFNLSRHDGGPFTPEALQNRLSFQDDLIQPVGADLGILHQEPMNHTLQRRRAFGKLFPDRPRLVGRDGVHDGREVIAKERMFPRKQLIVDIRVSEDVRALIGIPAGELLGSHVQNRSRNIALPRAARSVLVHHAGNPEIHHLHGSVWQHHDVAGLDIAVDHIFGVGVLQTPRDLKHDFDFIQQLNGHPGDLLGFYNALQGFAIQQLHHQIGHAVLQDGMPYLVMELLDGETLESVIKTQKVAGVTIQLLDKVEIMFQVARGLQYAHSENVVHRDIKPGNIMVLPNGTVKVMDFGIARVMDKDGTRRTRQGDIAGTILYMAPEQLPGRDADKRSDIFAYADVYYELLTGEHPFFGNDFATVMYRITANEPRPIREKLPECPAALESMIHRLLVKDPEIRPDRLDEVVLETQPVLQRLRRERAAVVAAEIEPLIHAGDLERAQVAIGQVLHWDPLNQVADRWREQIQKERARKAMSARAEALVRKGHEHLVARRFKEALQCFESALKLDQTNPEIRTLVDQVQITIENVRSAVRLVAEARTEMERGQLEHAVDKAARSAELDSGNPEAPELRDQLRQQIRSRREAAMLARAEGLSNGGDYDGAMAVLSEAEAAGLSSPKIAACRTRVERERAEAEKRRRQAAFAAALARAREALYGQRLQEASASAEALCAEYPEEPAASELLSEVREYLAAQRRLEAINQATQTARVLMKEKRLDDAREVLEAGLRAYPRDTGISRLMEIVNTLAAAQDRARKIGQVVRQAHRLADDGQLDAALRAVMDAIGEVGG